MRRFVFDVFDDKYLMSFGTKVSKKSLMVGEANLDLMIWDILGQKSQESLHAAYYRGASGALAVCDFTRPETMTSLRGWLDSFRSVVGDMPVMILGNKADLERKFTSAELEAFAKEAGCRSLETSAKTGLNVESAFQDIGKAVMEAV